jgi:hypothetical protein
MKRLPDSSSYKSSNLWFKLRGSVAPDLRTPNPGFNPELPLFYITNVGGEPRVKPGVWRPEMWAQKVIRLYCTSGMGKTIDLIDKNALKR